MTKPTACLDSPRSGRKRSRVRLAALSCLLLGSVACAPASGSGGTPIDGESGKGGGAGKSGGGSGSGGSSKGGSAAGASGSGGGGGSPGGRGGSGGSRNSGGGSGGAASGGDAGGASNDGAADARGAGGTSADGARADDRGAAETPTAYKIFVGQTHAHSSLSKKSHDFVGTDGPAAGFMKAKAAGADFYFITDHVDFDPISPADFAMVKAAADAASDATFVAAAGIEFHLSINNEVNAYDIDLDADHVEKATKVTGYQYADYLKTRYPGAFMQWTHPLRSGLSNHTYTGRTAERDEVIALLELLNEDDEPMESAYHQALDQGWHIGPSAGHDNHGEKWFTLGTRTGVLATSLTRQNIYDGLRQSRVFCSQDSKIRVWYDINGTIMGASTPTAATYKATVKIEGSTASKVEIITKAGKVVASGAPGNGVWSADLTGVTAGGFYYARLISSGGKTWTAPVWVQ
jgi:hypothetical protein